MPNTRVLLWFALAAVLFYNYQAWMQDYPAGPARSVASLGGVPPATLGESVPQAPSAAAPAAATPPPSAAPSDVPQAPTEAAPSVAAAPLHITTDVLDVVINLKGGELDQADLVKYPLRKDAPNVPVRLLSRDPPYLLQTGLIGVGGEPAPTHLAVWSASATSFVLADGADELRVPLNWSDAQGLTVTKTFIFKRGLYSVDLVYDLANNGSATRKLEPYSQFLRRWEHASRSYFDVETYSFKGPAVWDGNKSHDLNVESDSDSKFSQTISNGVARLAAAPIRGGHRAARRPALQIPAAGSRQGVSVEPRPVPRSRSRPVQRRRSAKNFSSDRNCSRSSRPRRPTSSARWTSAC